MGRVLALLTSVFFCGCTGWSDDGADEEAALRSGTRGTRAGASPDTAAQAAARRHFVTEGLGARIEPSRARIRAAIGTPDSVVVTTEPNRHVPNRTDSLFAVHYSGLEVTLRKAGGNELLESVIVRDNQWLADRTVAIGTSAEEALRQLGEPQYRDRGALGYLCLCGGEVEEPVWLVVRDGEVREIRFSYYVD